MQGQTRTHGREESPGDPDLRGNKCLAELAKNFSEEVLSANGAEATGRPLGKNKPQPPNLIPYTQFIHGPLPST